MNIYVMPSLTKSVSVKFLNKGDGTLIGPIPVERDEWEFIKP